MGVLAAVALAGCDIPTAAPKFDQQWAVPVAHDRVTVTDLLPASVRVENGAFRLALHPASATLRLQDICGHDCGIVGTKVPKPAFKVNLPLALKHPTDLAHVTLTGADTVHLRLTQALGFSFLNPSGAAAPGSLEIGLVVGGDTVRQRFDGATEPWRSGSTLDIRLPLPANATLGADLGVLIRIDSPAGDSITVDSNAELGVWVGLGETGTGALDIASVSALVRQVSISSSGVTLDLTSIARDVTDRAGSALFAFTINNPLDAVGHFTASFTANGSALIAPREITIEPGRSTVRLTLTRSELDALLGQHVTVGLKGTVEATAPSGLITLRPADAMSVDTQLTLNLVL